MESQQHSDLVGALRQWVVVNKPDLVAHIVTDTYSESPNQRPPRIGGKVPDLFAEDIQKNVTIIGEAKVGYDLETDHTSLQLCAFLDFLKHKKDGILLLSLELSKCRSGRSIVRGLIREREDTEAVRTYVITPIDFVA